MKSFLRICICSFIVAASISCTEDGFNENGVGVISGTVVQEGDNTPLSNVKITSVPASNTVFTDENGNFLIENVGAGDYSVQADKEEYITAVQAANVSNENVTNVVFELVKSTANNRPPVAPNLVFPADGATELGFTVEFIWESSDPDDDDISYILELRNGNTNDVETYDVAQDTTFTVNNLLLATNYFWQVTASDDINDPVVSAVSEFTTITELSNEFLFVKKENGNNVIYSGGESGSEVDFNLIALTDGNLNSFRPRRNYEVDKIAFLRTVGGNTHLFTMSFDGTNVDQVTTTVPVAGFRDNEIDFTWAKNGDVLYYPNFDKLYRIDPDGGGSTLLYQTTDGSLISDVDVPSFDDDLVVLKTNNVSGYGVRIFTLRLDAGTEETVVLESVNGAVGGVSIDANANRILYTWDRSGSQNPSYQIFESRMFIFDLTTMIPTEIETDVVIGENDLDPRFWPSEGGVVFTRKRASINNSPPKIFKADIDNSSSGTTELFTFASMPDWE